MARDQLLTNMFTFLFISVSTLFNHGLSTQVQTGEACSAGPNVDVKNLTNGIWTVSPPKGKCIGDGNCTVQLGLCQKLKLEGCSDASACMFANVSGQNKTVHYKLGSYVDNPFNLSKSVAGERLMVYLENGGNYTMKNKTNCTLSVEIQFNCNLNVFWVPGPKRNTSVPKNSLTSSNFDENTCRYRLAFDYEGVCTKIEPPLVPNLETLSAGSVLIILFFVSVSVYCICGCAVNGCRGYRGKDVLPQSEFWVDLPVLIADGFVFTFTCCKTENSAYDSI